MTVNILADEQSEGSRGPVSFEPVELSRVIPSHVKRIKFKWINAHFSTMGPAWRNVRKRMKNPADDCDWCHHKFEDGEHMGLGGPETGRNLLLCQTCIGLLQPSKPTTEARS